MRKKTILTLLCVLLLCTAASAADFRDVPANAWYAEGVQFMSGNGLMNGIGDGRFDPDGKVSRGMIVTILYRAENSPKISDASPFTDLVPGAYYEKAVIWAAKNGVVNGYASEAGKFAPEDSVTREQFAAILYRYCAYRNENVSTKGNLNSYSDAADVSGYAKNAMLWANANGLITGTSATTLSPQGTATRAQAAVILTRYLKSRSVSAPEAAAPGKTTESSAPTFVIGSASAGQGERGVQIRVAVRNNPGIASIGMQVTFDEELTLRAVKYDRSVGGEFMPPAKMTSPVRLTWISPFRNICEDWTFATLTFDVAETAKTGLHPITADYDADDVYNFDERNVFFSVSGGGITVSAP